jgi:hypothetical protein
MTAETEKGLRGHIVSAVWLRRIGNKVDVLVEIGGSWYLAIRENHDSYFGHIIELEKYSLESLKPDPIEEASHEEP